MDDKMIKTRSVAVVAGAGGVVWLLWLWQPTLREPDHNSAAVDPVVPTAALPAPNTPRLAFTRPPNGAAAAKPGYPTGAPIIHELTVDKQAVCRGEENFVNVRATGPDGSDAHLRVSLQGTSAVGTRIPFRLYSDAAANRPRILVEGRGGTEVTAPLPRVEVKDCEVEQTATIELTTVGASTNEWRLTGQVTSGTFKAESYEWDFGDGARSVSAAREIDHSYRFRTQDKRYSNFLIGLTMRNARGETLRTTRALGILNPAFGRLERHGEVTVFAERHVEGAGQEVTRLYHAYHAPVQMERVVLKVRDQAGRSEDVIGNYSPQESIGLRNLLPGAPAEIRLALANMDVPNTRPLLLVFEVTGSTTDGLPARGVFSTQLL